MATVALCGSLASADEVVLNVNDATNFQGTLVEERPAGTTSDKDAGEAKHYQPIESLEISGYSFTLVQGQKADGSAATEPSYYWNMSTSDKTQNTLRVYVGNQLTITAPAGIEITKIDFKGSKGNKDNLPTVSTGTVTAKGGTDMSWTGAAPTITFTYTNNFRIEEMTLTVGNAIMETVDMPTFTPASGTSFTDQLSVTIAAAEGATVYYTLDGTNPTTESNKYEAPIVLTATTTVKAIAVKEGMNNSGVATATYTKDAVVETLAEIIEAGLEGDEETVFTYGGEATVTYVNGSNLYVKDESAAILIYVKNLEKTYKQGDVLTGFKGSFKDYYSTWELMGETASFTDAAKTVEVAPTEMTIGTITNMDQNQYIVLRGVDVDPTALTLKKESDEIGMYDKFKVEMPAAAGTYDVTGIVSYYQAKGADAPALQIYPISFDEPTSVESIEAENGVRVEGGNIIAPANAEIYSISGIRVNGNKPAAGLYIVRAGGKATKVLVK